MPDDAELLSWHTDLAQSRCWQLRVAAWAQLVLKTCTLSTCIAVSSQALMSSWSCQLAYHLLQAALLCLGGGLRIQGEDSGTLGRVVLSYSGHTSCLNTLADHGCPADGRPGLICLCTMFQCPESACMTACPVTASLCGLHSSFGLIQSYIAMDVLYA